MWIARTKSLSEIINTRPVEYLSKEHQAKEILFLAHTISGSHLSISKT